MLVMEIIFPLVGLGIHLVKVIKAALGPKPKPCYNPCRGY